MKNTLFLVASFIVIFLSSCSSNDCESVVYDLKLVRSELAARDSIIEEVGLAMSAIDSNIAQIGILELELSKNLKDSPKGKKEKIQANIDELKTVMEFNQGHIEQMQRSLGANAKLSDNLMGVVQSMEQKVLMSNLRLAQHNNELGNLGDDFKNLFDEYMAAEYAKMELEDNLSQMEGSISEMEEKMVKMKKSLNTAYYVKGTRRELIENGVLEKGGLFNNKDINEDVDKSAFEKLNIRKLSIINFESNKVKVVTEHPSESYELVKDDNDNYSIKISDKEAFWSLSKYLIVVEG